MLVPGARGNCFGMYLLCPRTLSSGRDGVGVGEGDCGCGGVCRNDLLGSGDMGGCVCKAETAAKWAEWCDEDLRLTGRRADSKQGEAEAGDRE